MEMYNASDNRNGESHLIQINESYPSLMYPLVEQFDFDAMYNEGASEFIEQGLYYPTATNYGYYCTGFESPSEWEDHYKIFGVDGLDFQYAGAQTENLPFVYYTPSHAYAQSPYNPYNPFIPGAVIGVDGPYGGAQQYYSIPSFQDTVSSPACGSVVIPPDMISSSFPDPLLNTGASITNRTDGRGLKNSVASASAAYPSNPSKPSLIQKHSFTKFSEGPRAKANIGPNNHSVIIRSVSSGSSTAAPSLVLQGRTSSGSTQPLDDISSGKVLPPPNQVKAVVSNGNACSDFQSSARGRSAVDKLLPKTAVGQPLNTMGRNPDMCMFTEQNRGPRTSRSKDQLAVKAYTSKAGVTDAEGNIIICTEHYNEEDFQVDYVDAKFFVIKSYSEDDVHKSIKYGVWSSTSHGNKKLQSAYEDAQKLAAGKPGGCPIFLFFSVNASSQFCGVAEMIGPVDFYKDMDFWQQDKWSGSFPVKWHIIKDVPNTSLRHIILRNNENKPVTNSRDTQEIMHTEGLEMLKIFKNHPRDTSLFDDFMYYEKRQKFMQEERARLVFKSFQRPFFSPALGLADKLNRVVQLPLKEVNFCKLFIFIFLVSAVSLSSSSNAGSEYSQAECLKVPASSFMSSLKTTVDAIQQVVPVISNFANLFGDFRLTNAISDCLDLLDFSADELSWSISASQNPTGRHNGSGDLSSDLRTWLSAALINQETCIDGFDGTNSIVKGVVSGSLNQISSSVQELLTMVHPSPSQWSNEGSSSNSGGKGRGGGGKSSGQFPHWFKREDRKLLLVNGVQADVVVAADGTGNFTKIMDAVLAAEDYSMKRFVIYIKRGVYKENVEIKKKKWNLMMVGDGIDATIISGNRNFMDGWTTFRSATFAVSGRGFIARDITFENTAGPEKHQAVALRSDSDLSVYFRCAIKGYQDSLYTHTMRQFFRECKISGTVDFIFGDATAMFQNCQILAKKGLDNQKNTITAHGRKDPNEPTGFSIQFCNITADSDLLPFVNSTETYLGRPWKLYSRTVFMQSYMSNVIRPKGWLEWNNDFALDTLYYGEYKNYGPGGGLATRITWPGYHILNNAVQANNFTVAQFLEGNLWLPSTGVKYTAGLQV